MMVVVMVTLLKLDALVLFLHLMITHLLVLALLVAQEFGVWLVLADLLPLPLRSPMCASLVASSLSS